MGPSIEDFKDLIRDVLPAGCADGAFYINVSSTPARILESYTVLAVTLWAQSLTGSDIIVNLMMPSTRRLLLRLASNGVGASSDHNGVRYRFMPGE